MTFSLVDVPSRGTVITTPVHASIDPSLASWARGGLPDDPAAAPGRIIRSAVASPAAPPGSQAQLLAENLGQLAARQAGLQPSKYTKAALSALGEQVLLDHAQQPGGAVNVVLGVGAAHAVGGAVSGPGAALDKRIEQAAATLANQYRYEFAVLNGIYDLAELKMPTRRGLAASVLEKAGLKPERLMNTDPGEFLPGLRNTYNRLRKIFHRTPWESAAQYYFDADKLSDDDIIRMHDKPPGAAKLREIKTTLPPSLKGEFDKEFAGFVSDYARVVTQLLGAWIPGAAAQHGIDIGNAQVTVTRAHAQHYIKDTRVLPYEGPRDLGEPRQELTSHGYLVSIGTGDKARRLFLSALDGKAHPLPAGVTLRKWVQDNSSLVFGDDMAEAAAQAPHYKWRMTVEEVGHGRGSAMKDWLDNGARAEMNKNLEEARGQNWDESVKDFLLNLIPLRATIVSLKKGDYLQALSSASMDAMVVLPLLASGVRAASLAVRAAAPMMRAGALEAGAGAIRASALTEDITAALAAGMRRGMAEAPGAVVETMGPLDLERMAGTLMADHPRLAVDLEAAAGEARGLRLRGKWRPINAAADAARADGAASRLSAAMPRDELSAVSEARQFINDEGEKLDLLPMGDGDRFYTERNAEGGAAGMVLMTDASGDAHPLLPLQTLRRYRVDPDRLRNATLVRANSADGTVVSANRHYVALGDDFLEVVPDRALSSGRTIWRAQAPRGARPDPVLHRLLYDRELNVWRRPNPEELGLRGGGGGPSRHLIASAGRNAAELGEIAPKSTAELRELLAKSLRVSGATPKQMETFGAVMQRAESSAKGSAMMRALHAHHASTGLAPQIVLRDGASAEAAARPSMARRVHTYTWNLDLEALDKASAHEIADELAGVYNNITGILEFGYQYVPPEIERPFDPKLESAWARWLDTEIDKTPKPYMEMGRRLMGPSDRTRALNVLRPQLQQLRAHGGVTNLALKRIMRATSEQGAKVQALLGASVNLTDMNFMDGLPPIPEDVLSLNLSSSRVGNWSGLPKNLVALDLSGTGIARVPRNLPRGILRLNLSNNTFTKLDLWEGLQVVILQDAELPRVLVMPDSVLELDASGANIMKIKWQPTSRLRTIDIQNSAVKSLTRRLPPELRSLDISSTSLESLPDLLDTRLESLNLSGLSMREVPPVTRTLRNLDLSYVRNRGGATPFRITSHLMELNDCVIDLDMTFITQADLPPRLPGQPGPRFTHLYYPVMDSAAPAIEQLRPTGIENVLKPWFAERGAGANAAAESYADVLARWKAIAEKEGNSQQFEEFRVFVRRLGETVNARDKEYGEAFRAEVRDWLVECSKPDREELRQDTFAMCLNANESCQDRTTWVFSKLKTIRLRDDIKLGRYDGRVADVGAAAREAYAKDVIEEIATRKADAIEKESKRAAELREGPGAWYPKPKRLDIYLAYLVKLGEPAGVRTTGTRSMRFFEMADVPEEEIDQAWPELRERLSSAEFETYLSRTFHPWKRYLKRNFQAAYDEAKTKLRNTMENELQDRLKEEVRAMKIDTAAQGAEELEEDVVRTRGPIIRDQIWDETVQKVTRDFLRANRLEHLLEPGAWPLGELKPLVRDAGVATSATASLPSADTVLGTSTPVAPPQAASASGSASVLSWASH